MDTVLTVAIAVGLSPAMAGAWAVERATGGWIDPIWPLAVGLGSICAALLAYGDFGRRNLVLTFIAVWASRFANHVSSRSHGSAQDPRYAEFIEQKSDRAASRLYLFLQIQARTAFILVPAVYLAAANDTPLGRLLDGLAVLIAIVALTGEAISDRQLAHFRRTPEAKTDVCDFGLWRYSRDQNYVLKWLSGAPVQSLRFRPSHGQAHPCWRQRSCIGYRCIFPASRRLKNTCCARVAAPSAPPRTASTPSFPDPVNTENCHEHAGFRNHYRRRTPLTDGMSLAGIDFLCSRTKRKLTAMPASEEQTFAETMERFPVATHTDDANRQHYEVPAEFFALALGPQRKYSCCLYPTPETTLEEAETYALAETVKHAEIVDGMRILELGCGWGSLSLYLAEQFPNSRITSVSNSASQRAYILDLASRRGLTNLTVITADMNDFATYERFDRVVSVEMFEHMSNWRTLLERVRAWVKPDGKLFLHVFTHKNRSYRFDRDDPTDWIAQHFFTGGIMPAHDLPHRFGDFFNVEQEWRWSGTHYRRTALDWVADFDRNIDRIQPIFRRVYGKDASLRQRRWRLFFLATAGLFGHDNGDVWGVGHYLLSPSLIEQRA